MKSFHSSNDLKASPDRIGSYDVTEMIDFKNRCGLLKWRPNCLQRLRNIYLFLLTMCVVCVIQTALSAGYLSSQITTLERRFSLDSYMLGLIQSFFEVGFIISVVFVGYFGGQGRIPFWIGFGMLVMGTGALVFTLPQFISHSDHISPGKVQDPNICLSNYSTNAIENCDSNKKTNWTVKLLFIIGQILIGCGSSPILSLAPTYIDDHVPGTLAAPLIALLYASAALGPVVGFGLGVLMLQYPSNSDQLQSCKPGDYNWIGAWWLGYVCLGIVATSTTIFLFLFPRRVKKIRKSKIESLFKVPIKSNNSLEFKQESVPSTDGCADSQVHLTSGEITLPTESPVGSEEPDIQVTDNKKRNTYGKSIKDMPTAIKSLILNKVYVVVTSAICFEMFLINGIASFLPKYIENEYKVSSTTAGMIIGGFIVPAGAVGIVSGGLIMHKFQMSRRRSVLLSIVCVILVLLCMVFFFILSCNNPLFAGINMAIYHNYSKSQMNISNTCNSDICSNKCNPNQFLPLCDAQSAVTYFSACHAGCSNYTFDQKAKKLFHNCSCTSVNENMTSSMVLASGECPLQCNALTSFVVFLTIAIFLTGITQNPLLMVTMRSVATEERSFALGFQFVILRIIAFIPSPIIYGNSIDSACVYWKMVCGERGDCLVTDLKLLNYYLIGLSFAVKCGAAVFYTILFFVIPKDDTDNK